ncbi:hypothetical protein IAU60_003723 [Kwoniella sp. DSM 27419]
MNTSQRLLRKIPLFIAFCPDAKGANVLSTRLKVRPEHFVRVEQDKKDGVLEFGRGFVPPSGSPLHTNPDLKPGQQAMAGSVMFFRLPDLDAAWARVKEDVYWTEGVWDREACRVEEFLRMPEDDQ